MTRYAKRSFGVGLNSASSFPITLLVLGDARAASTTRYERAGRFDLRARFVLFARASAHGGAPIRLFVIRSFVDADGFFTAATIGATPAAGIVCHGAIRVDLAIRVVMTLGRSRRSCLLCISLASGIREDEEQHHTGESIGQLRSAHPAEVSRVRANVNRRRRGVVLGCINP